MDFHSDCLSLKIFLNLNGKCLREPCCRGWWGPCTKCQGLADHIFIFYITRVNNTSFDETEIFYLNWKLLLILKTFKQTSIIKNWTQCYHEGGCFYSWSKNRMRLWTTDSPYFLYNMSKSPSNLSSSCKSQVNFPIT